MEWQREGRECARVIRVSSIRGCKVCVMQGCFSLSLAYSRSVRLKSECGSRQHVDVHTHFAILDSTDCTARACAPVPSHTELNRTEPNRADPRERMRASHRAFLPRRPSPCVLYLPPTTIYGLCISLVGARACARARERKRYAS